MKKDYMVTTYNTDEEIYNTLTEARKRAKALSKEYGEAQIHRWVQIYADVEEKEYDESFQIIYENGIDTSKPTRKKVRLL